MVTPRSHFLTDLHNLYAKMRVSGQGCCPLGALTNDNIRLHLGGQTPKTPKQVGMGILQPNRQSSKAIYQSPTKIFASYFTHRFSTGGTI